MKNLLAILYCAFTSAAVMAQSGSGGAQVDVNVTKDGGNIPWLWIIGGVLVVVLLVALLGRSGDKVVVKE